MLAIWYVATSDSLRACCKGGMANEKKKKDDSFGGLGMVTKWSVQQPKIIWDRSTASVYKNMYLGKFFVAPVH